VKLVLTVLVRDEIDVIATMLDYHLAFGVDTIIATDNGSVDGTREVLASYERRGLLRLLDEAPSDFSQHRWVTRMAELAYSDHAADWVIHADADELFVALGHASLKDALGGVASDVSVLKIERHDFVPIDRPRQAPPQVEMVYRKRVSLNLRGAPLPPKVMHRGVPACRVTQGNHGVEGEQLGPPVSHPGIVVYHYPIRSYAQFASKVRNGGSGYARNQELASNIGFHKRHWYDLLLRNELEALYNATYHHDEARLKQGLEQQVLVLDDGVAKKLAPVSAAEAHRPALPGSALRLVPGKARPRVLYILKNYPQLSQTYIKTELRALGDRYDVKLVATSTPNFPDPEALPYTQVPKIDDLIAEARRFEPHAIHGHYLVQAKIIRQVAEGVGKPFTIRAHSFDILTPGTKTAMPQYVTDLPGLLNDDLCLGVLAMPFAVPLLVEHARVDAAKVISSPPVVDFNFFYDRAANTGGVMNTGACIPKKAMEDFVVMATKLREYSFDLYAIGHDIDKLSKFNAEHGSPVNIHLPIPYAAMRAAYKQHRWLLYTGSFKMKTVGWPMAVVEAMASGVVVCVARVRPDLDDYLGGAGYVYETLDEAEAILRRRPDEATRQRGFERASELDIRKQLPLLTDLWDAAASRA
jgi:glycosyltransferase involved in cell wall biosynthesis